jgi:putative oxidoreductase
MTTTTLPARSESTLSGLYTRFAKFAGTLQSPLMLLIRIYIGYQCAISGLAHLNHFDATVKQFQEWKIPAPHLSVAVSASTELVGGTLLLLGVASRLICIPLIINFLFAMIQTDLAYPGSRTALQHIWNNQDIILKDTAFPFFAAAVFVLVYGPGWFSVDGLIKLLRRK